jgi:hypothetical protein
MWNFSQSLWQDKPWLGQVIGDFFRRDAQRVRLSVIVTQESASSSERLRFDEERSKKSPGLRYNGAEKEVVCLS